MADQEVNHPMSGVARRLRDIFRRFDHNPGVCAGVWGNSLARFDERSGERLLLMQTEAQGNIQRTLDAVDADLAIALSGMAISATEECAVIVDGKIELGACA